MAIADLDFSLITKRKRMMDSVGHYARPDLLQLQVNTSRTSVEIDSKTNSHMNSDSDRTASELLEKHLISDR
ncbi:hypothetical protein [Phormidesmis priestleyi]